MQKFPEYLSPHPTAAVHHLAFVAKIWFHIRLVTFIRKEVSFWNLISDHCLCVLEKRKKILILTNTPSIWKTYFWLDETKLICPSKARTLLGSHDHKVLVKNACPNTPYHTPLNTETELNSCSNTSWTGLPLKMYCRLFDPHEHMQKLLGDFHHLLLDVGFLPCCFSNVKLKTAFQMQNRCTVVPTFWWEAHVCLPGESWQRTTSGNSLLRWLQVFYEFKHQNTLTREVLVTIAFCVNAPPANLQGIHAVGRPDLQSSLPGHCTLSNSKLMLARSKRPVLRYLFLPTFQDKWTSVRKEDLQIYLHWQMHGSSQSHYAVVPCFILIVKCNSVRPICANVALLVHE